MFRRSITLAASAGGFASSRSDRVAGSQLWFMCALDISAFADVAEFKRDVDEIYAQMKGSATGIGIGTSESVDNSGARNRS